jgi:hypothetical protein
MVKNRSTSKKPIKFPYVKKTVCSPLITLPINRKKNRRRSTFDRSWPDFMFFFFPQPLCLASSAEQVFLRPLPWPSWHEPPYQGSVPIFPDPPHRWGTRSRRFSRCIVGCFQWEKEARASGCHASSIQRHLDIQQVHIYAGERGGVEGKGAVVLMVAGMDRGGRAWLGKDGRINNRVHGGGVGMHRSGDGCCWTLNGRQRRHWRSCLQLSGDTLALVLVKKGPKKHLRTSNDHRGDWEHQTAKLLLRSTPLYFFH